MGRNSWLNLKFKGGPWPPSGARMKLHQLRLPPPILRDKLGIWVVLWVWGQGRILQLLPVTSGCDLKEQNPPHFIPLPHQSSPSSSHPSCCQATSCLPLILHLAHSSSLSHSPLIGFLHSVILFSSALFLAHPISLCCYLVPSLSFLS